MALTASKAFCSGSSAKLAKKSSRATTVRMPVVVRAQAGEQAAEVVRIEAFARIARWAKLCGLLHDKPTVAVEFTWFRS